MSYYHVINLALNQIQLEIIALAAELGALLKFNV
jgi:hypothetical protein